MRWRQCAEKTHLLPLDRDEGIWRQMVVDNGGVSVPCLHGLTASLTPSQLARDCPTSSIAYRYHLSVPLDQNHTNRTSILSIFILVLGSHSIVFRDYWGLQGVVVSSGPPVCKACAQHCQLAPILSLILSLQTEEVSSLAPSHTGLVLSEA